MYILVSILILISLILSITLIYVLLNKGKFTRERYAFQAMAACSSIFATTLIAILSGRTIPMAIMDTMLVLAGKLPPAHAPPLLSTSVLLVLLAAVAAHFILQPYKNWKGATSIDEAESIRLHLNVSFFSQSFDEAHRLIKNEGPRLLESPIRRTADFVTAPNHIELVWKDHIRELFSLWHGQNNLHYTDSYSYDSVSQCYIGRDSRTLAPIYLFHREKVPGQIEINWIFDWLENEKPQANSTFFIVHRSLRRPHKKKLKQFEILSESYLLDHIVSLEDYFSDIVRRVNVVPLPESGTTIANAYVPLGLRKSSDNSEAENMDLLLAEWASSKIERQLAILGDYGQGKSTGALMYVHRCIQDKLVSSGGRIPILFELRGKSPANLQPMELISTWSQRYRIPPQSLMKLIQAGRTLIIFEGFDEMANVGSAEERLSHFRALWQFSLPGSKIMFTGRPNFFFEEKELEVIFSLSTGGIGFSSCDIYRILPLDAGKMQTALRWAPDKDVSEILSAANGNINVMDLLSRPSLLFIVASLWPEFRNDIISGRFTSAQVIDEFIIHSYRRQADKDKIIKFMTLTTTERRYFHEGIALYMGIEGGTNQVRSDILQMISERLYRCYPSDSHISSDVYLEEDIPFLKIRIEEQVAVERISTDVRTHGILVNDLAAPGAFKFSHKSFSELLYAKVLYKWILGEEIMFYNAIQAALEPMKPRPPYPPQVLDFLAQMIFSRIISSGEKNFVEAAFHISYGTSDMKAWTRSYIRSIAIFGLRLQYGMLFRKIRLLYIFGLLPIVLMAIYTAVSLIIQQQVNHEAQSIFLTSIAVSMAVFMVSALMATSYSRVSRHKVASIRPDILWISVVKFRDETEGGTFGMNQIRRVLGSDATDRLLEVLEPRDADITEGAARGR